MPVVQKVMDALVARYGKDRGESVYYAMEGEGKGPFGPNGKYHAMHVDFAKAHGLKPIGKKKAPTLRKRRGRKG